MFREPYEWHFTDQNGDQIHIKIRYVKHSLKQPEGIVYSFVYIKNGERLVGYDNFEGHTKEGSNHHKHIKDRIIAYKFIDEWTTIQEFHEDIEKIRRGTLK